MKLFQMIVLIVLVCIIGVGFILFMLASSSGHAKEVRIVNISFTSPVLSWIKCVVEANKSLIIRVCGTAREWKEIVLSNGTILRSDGLPLRDRYTIYLRIEMADLVRKRTYVYEAVNLSFLGLGLYRRLIYNQSFDYRWLDLSQCYAKASVPRATLHQRGNATIVLALAGFTYTNISCKDTTCVLTYRPLDVERMKLYAFLAENICKVVKTFTGLNCKVIIVDASKYCFIPRNIVVFRRDRSLEFNSTESFYCERVNDIDVLRIIESPAPLTFGNIYNASGVNYGGKWILVYTQNHSSPMPSPVITTMPYALGASSPKLHEGLPRWCVQLFNRTIELNIAGLTLGEAITMAIALYNDYVGNLTIQKIIESNLRSLGVDPIKFSVLLPITEDGEIPPPFSSIIEEGILKIVYHKELNRFDVQLNRLLIEILRSIAGNNTSTT